MNSHDLTSLWAMAFVAAYILSTVPFLVLTPLIHRSKTEARPWLLAGCILQIIPLGLIFFPLGLAGAAVLGAAWLAILRRNRLFAKASIPRPDLAVAWRFEAILAGWGMGLALQQKAFAFGFLEATRGQAGWLLVGAVILLLLLVWLPLGWWLRQAHQNWQAARLEHPIDEGSWHSPKAQ